MRTARLHSPAESDEYVSVSYVTDGPRKRDFLKVLLGRWTPTVRRSKSLTAKGMSRELKAVWTSDAIRSQLHGASVLMNGTVGSGTVGFFKQEDPAAG